MKKQLLTATLFACLFLLLGGCQSKTDVKEGEYRIEGNLSNVPDGVIISLYHDNGPLLKYITVDTLRGGRFSFHDTISVASQSRVILSDSEGVSSSALRFWVGSGKLTEIKGKNLLLHTWIITCDLPEQAAEKRFSSVAPEESKALDELSIEQSRLKRAKREDRLGISMEEYKVRKDSLNHLEKILEQTIMQKEIELMKKEPISFAWLDRMYTLAFHVRHEENYIFKEDAKRFFAQMTDSDKQTPIGKEICQYMEEVRKVGVGDMMADGDLFDLDGKKHNLAELAGKYILLDFWSSSCGPCRQAIPELREIALSNTNLLHIVSICSDPESMWRKTSAELKLDGLNWNQFKGHNGLTANYQVKSIPHYVMIDPQGKITDTWSGYAPGMLKEKIKGIIARLAKYTSKPS